MKKKQKNIHWVDRNKLIEKAQSAMQQVDVILDIGSGIMPQDYIKPMVHICAEPFEQYVTFLQKKISQKYDRQYIILKTTWDEVVKIFPAKSVDSIFLIDVIEHLKKKDALELIQKSEKIARKQIIIFTPLGFVKQKHPDGKDAWGLDGGKWQEHHSGWIPEDFDNTWSIFACSEFHLTDNLGKPYKKPVGAFWAIKNLTYNNEDLSLRKEITYEIFRSLVQLHNIMLLKFFAKSASFLIHIKKIRDQNIS